MISESWGLFYRRAELHKQCFEQEIEYYLCPPVKILFYPVYTYGVFGALGKRTEKLKSQQGEEIANPGDM